MHYLITNVVGVWRLSTRRLRMRCESVGYDIKRMSYVAPHSSCKGSDSQPASITHLLRLIRGACDETVTNKMFNLSHAACIAILQKWFSNPFGYCFFVNFCYSHLRWFGIEHCIVGFDILRPCTVQSFTRKINVKIGAHIQHIFEKSLQMWKLMLDAFCISCRVRCCVSCDGFYYRNTTVQLKPADCKKWRVYMEEEGQNYIMTILFYW